MKIYLVEEREQVENRDMADYIAIFCSSEEKARAYCENYNGLPCDSDYWWWLVIREYELDNEDHQEVIAFYDNTGKEISVQPLKGYHDE